MITINRPAPYRPPEYLRPSPVPRQSELRRIRDTNAVASPLPLGVAPRAESLYRLLVAPISVRRPKRRAHKAQGPR